MQSFLVWSIFFEFYGPQQKKGWQNEEGTKNGLDWIQLDTILKKILFGNKTLNQLSHQ
jgi:hypothetical protein